MRVFRKIAAAPRSFCTEMNACAHDPTVQVVGAWMFGLWLVFAVFMVQPFRLTINRTDSEPLGIYLIHLNVAPADLAHGELLAFHYRRPWPVPPYTTYPTGAVFLKRVTGLPGDIVNTKGRCEYVNGKPEGCALKVTKSGTLIPHFAVFHHQTIPPDHFYLSSTLVPNSYDSRYFGLVSNEQVIGTARLLVRF